MGVGFPAFYPKTRKRNTGCRVSCVAGSDSFVVHQAIVGGPLLLEKACHKPLVTSSFSLPLVGGLKRGSPPMFAKSCGYMRAKLGLCVLLAFSKPRGPGEASQSREAKIAARQFLPLSCCAITLTGGGFELGKKPSLAGERQRRGTFKRQFGRG